MSTPPDLGPLPAEILALSAAHPQMALAVDLPDLCEAERQRCYMLGVAAERERCIAWVRYWLTGAAPEAATHEARCILSLKSGSIAPLPSAPTKEGG